MRVRGAASILLIVCVAGLPSGVRAGVTNWVSGGGDDLTGDGSESNAYRSISKALQTPGISMIHVGSGTYATNSGETFPITIPDGVSVAGTGAPSDSVVDADLTNSAFFLGGGSSTNLLGKLSITRTKGTAILADAWQGSLEDLVITDIANGGAMQNTSIIYYTNSVSRTVTVARCSFTNISCNVQKFLYFRGYGKVTFTNCLFRNLTTSLASSQGHGNFHFSAPSGSVASNGGFSATFLDCVIDGLTTPGQGNQEAGVFKVGSSAFLIWDRCLVRNVTLSGTGTMLFAPDRSNGSEARNSLFYNCDCGTNYTVIGGFRSTVYVRNCTFHDVNAVFRPTPDGAGYFMYAYNSLVTDCGLLCRLNQDNLFLYNVNTNNTPPGVGYNTTVSTNVTGHLPWYVDAAASNFHLRAVSPLVDIGRTNYVLQGARDLDGDLRIRDGDGDGVTNVDLGCYEVNFSDPASSRFITEKPAYHLFGGQTLNVPVWIKPAASGTVTGAVAYGQDLSGTNRLSYATGSETSALSVTAAFPLTVSNGTLVLVSVSETDTVQGVQTGEIGVYLHDAMVTVPGYVSRIFARPGVTNQYRAQLEDSSLSAQIPVTMTLGTPSGSGNNQISWIGGNTITNGGWQTEGYIEIVGGDGQNTVNLSVDSDYRVIESGASNLGFEVVGWTSPLYVSPTGSDVTGLGTPGSPLGTIAYTLSLLRTGEEAVLAAGTYGTNTGEVFPVQVGEGIYATGVIGPNSNATDSSVIDAGGSGHGFLLGTLGPDEPFRGPGGLRNLIITGARGTAVRGRYWGGTISNCIITAIGVGGAQDDTAVVRILSDSTRTVTVSRLTVTNISVNTARFTHFSGPSGRASVLVMRDCLFRGLSTSGAPNRAPFLCDEWAVDMADCVFDGITVPGDDADEDGLIRSYDRWTTVDRCIVRNIAVTNSALCLFMFNRGGPHVIRNSLIHSVTGGTNRPAIGGFRSDPAVRNCAIDGVRTAFRVPDDTNYAISVYNSSVSSCSNFNQAYGNRLRLYNVNVYDTPMGQGYDTNLSVSVTTFDPGYQNRLSGNYRLSFQSPLLNAGSNAFVEGTLDLDGLPRIFPPGGDVDIGPYECVPPPGGTVLTVR